MFKCSVCEKVFTVKCNMLRHTKSHEQMKFQCIHCNQDFTRRSNLSVHMQKKHGFVKQSNDYNLAMGIVVEQQQLSLKFQCGHCKQIFIRRDHLTDHVQKTHGIHKNNLLFYISSLLGFVKYGVEYNRALGITVGQQSLSSGVVDCVASSSNANVIVSPQAPTPPTTSVKRTKTNSARNIVKFKKARIGMVNTPVWYYRGNTDNCLSYPAFLDSIKLELMDEINYCMRINPIKYNLKLEAVYIHRELPSEDRAFKTVSREVYIHSDVGAMVDEDFAALMSEEDRYIKKGSGFTLSSIDGLLLGIYEHTPLGGSSYIPLPENIVRKKAVINPRNMDDEYFKWAILAKYVIDDNRNNSRVGKNYYNEEHRYDFSELSSPTPISEICIFERRNREVSVNVYGLKPGKVVGIESIVYPIKVVENEKVVHFELLVIEGSERMHYTYISNFSRLVRSQKTSHESRLFICKRCFTSFDERVKINKLCGNEALQQHMRLCGPNKPILPVMPKEGEVLRFNGWASMQRHPFAIYADFEALLEKQTEGVGASTEGIHAHHLMSYGYFVKAAVDVPVAIMEKYDIPQAPLIYRGSESRDEVAKHFVVSVTALAIRLGNLLKATNVPISMSVEEVRVHNAKSVCDMCKLAFTETRCKVADHCHLSGRLRHTLCAPCKLKLVTLKFLPCFLHNLSKYDAHFIVTELGYDKESITVIPNSEEDYISFSKYILPDFSVRFLDSCRFMASSLAELAGNLVTKPGEFEKFRETAKVFQSTDMALITRKGVFPYEYTDKWSRLEETALPPKHDFYSVLFEKHVTDEDYCPILGDYSDLYLKVDVLLLADVMENFRDLCMSTYNLDPVYYYTAPGFTFDAMLRYTGVSLELLTDYNMVLFTEQGIRGGGGWFRLVNGTVGRTILRRRDTMLRSHRRGSSTRITDSLIYRIHTEDFYKDLLDNPALLERMDTSNLPATHPCYVVTRKKIPGLFKDETAGRTMYEFIALRAKSYAYKIEGDEKLVAKGIRGHVVRNHMTFEDHKRCLFEVDGDNAVDGTESEEVSDDDDDYMEDDFDDDVTLKGEELKRRARLMARSVVSTIHKNVAAATTAAIAGVEFTPTPLPPYTPYTPYRQNVSIRSFEHRVKTIKTMKMTLNRFDDKRVVDDDRIRTRAYGHYVLRE
ncbi:hypothetical protein QTP88_024147 [Uroleucon formosanum]